MTAFRCGYIGIFGRPNVGKSTFLNQVLGEKVAIVTDKPQTTRNRIVGIKNLTDAQLILIDTPGIHRPRGALNQALVDCTLAVLRDVDVSLFFFAADASSLTPGEEDLLALLVSEKRSFLPVFNKIDLVDRRQRELPLYGLLAEYLPDKQVPMLGISALKGTGIGGVLQAVVQKLPESPAFFPPDVHTDMSERFWVQEIIREKIFQLTRQEVPYGATALIDYFHDKESRLVIGATIYVEHSSQKGIIVGRQGQMVKAIGTAARREVESLVGIPVFLELRVAVEKKWTSNPAALKRFGYR
ncbi:MAG: GTPase Era [Deltaproteobacteria bacterium]|nr:GTPase Era [Candidatus Anaeroferrophillus wilburensis]MBN2888124.1 GTPase Era [Deltaproteobacteria bacterium]